MGSSPYCIRCQRTNYLPTANSQANTTAPPQHGSTTLPVIQGIQTFTSNIAGAQTPIELFSPTTPAARVINQPPSSGLLDAVVIGGCAPPVPKKLAEKIWSGEFVDFDMLLPANLGAPELTMRDLLANKNRPVKSSKVESFKQWIICFNTYLSVLSMKHPQRVRDMLAYASLMAKASREFDGTPWLLYDRHFRRLATAQQQWNWSLFTVDALLSKPKAPGDDRSDPQMGQTQRWGFIQKQTGISVGDQRQAI